MPLALAENKEHQALKRWDVLTDFIKEWFYGPDLEAVEIAISAAVGHYFREDKPIWLMVLGTSGSSKTSLVLKCLEAFPYCTAQDDLSTSTFLSGLSMGKENQYSLLHNIGTSADRSGILLFPDFTAFMSKRSEEREQVMGQLRRIYDGEFDRTIGNGRLSWTGKVTIIAAATPEVERIWALQRSMGERFVQVRWARGDGIEQAKAAVKQVEHETYIAETLKKLTHDFIFIDERPPKPLPMFKNYEEIGAIHLAELVARLRVHVPRERDGRREIADVPPEAEAPTRIIKAMGQLARARATAFSRGEVNPEDFRVSRRIALDSIPPLRKRILDLLAQKDETGQVEILEKLALPRSTAIRSLEDMQAIGALTSYEQGVERKWLISDLYKELLGKAKPLLEL